MKKWTKLPHGISWETVRGIMRERRRKQIFVNKLKHGNEVKKRRTTGSAGPM